MFTEKAGTPGAELTCGLSWLGQVEEICIFYVFLSAIAAYGSHAPLASTCLVKIYANRITGKVYLNKLIVSGI